MQIHTLQYCPTCPVAKMTVLVHHTELTEVLSQFCAETEMTMAVGVDDAEL